MRRLVVRRQNVTRAADQRRRTEGGSRGVPEEERRKRHEDDEPLEAPCRTLGRDRGGGGVDGGGRSPASRGGIPGNQRQDHLREQPGWQPRDLHHEPRRHEPFPSHQQPDQRPRVRRRQPRLLSRRYQDRVRQQANHRHRHLRDGRRRHRRDPPHRPSWARHRSNLLSRRDEDRLRERPGRQPRPLRDERRW